MKRAFLLGFCLSVTIFNFLSAQDYSTVDAHAFSVPADGGIGTVANMLVAPYDTETEKVRAIFAWVANHVRYDCKEFKRPPQDRHARTREQQINRAFKNRLAICSGYSNLFAAMCTEVGIEAEVVTGYARKSLRCPNPERLPSSHAWNAVKIDGEWQLLDVTWAAGYVKGDCDRFEADFYDYYFLTPPVELIRRHWPDDPKWQLLPEEMSAEDFVSQPFFERVPKGAKLGEISPSTGSLAADVDNYTFEIEVEGAHKMAVMIGTKLHFMEEQAENIYQLTLDRSVVRGRTIKVVFFRDDHHFKPIVTYRRLG